VLNARLSIGNKIRAEQFVRSWRGSRTLPEEAHGTIRRKNHERENRNEPLFAIVLIWKSHDS